MTIRDLPSALKRRLRQEAGFGCCVCGHPFIEYHHIVPFAGSQHHEPDDMMVLCPIHHHQCTVGAFTAVQQRKAKTAPFNVARGFVEGQLLSPSPLLAIEAASVQLVGAGFKFVVDGEPLLQMRSDADGHLLLSLSLHARDDSVLLVVEDNEWIAGDPIPWDIEFSYNRLVLRRAERHIALSIDVRQSPARIGGDLWKKGQHFSLGRDKLSFNGVVKDIGLKDLALVAMYLEADTEGGTFRLVPDGRLGAGGIVSWPDPSERVARAERAYWDLLAKAKIGRNEQCPCESGKKYKLCHGRLL